MAGHRQAVSKVSLLALSAAATPRRQHNRCVDNISHGLSFPADEEQVSRPSRERHRPTALAGLQNDTPLDPDPYGYDPDDFPFAPFDNYGKDEALVCSHAAFGPEARLLTCQLRCRRGAGIAFARHLTQEVMEGKAGEGDWRRYRARWKDEEKDNAERWGALAGQTDPVVSASLCSLSHP